MAITEPNPLPADLAFPPGEEPISDEELAGFMAEVLACAEDAAIDPEAALVALMTEPGDVEPRPAARWRIEDDGAAEWALRHLARIDAEGDEIAEQAAAWIAEIERWSDERMRPLVARRAFFEGAALDYLRRLREQDPKIKSRKLPSGTLKSTASGEKIAIADEAAVIAWAVRHLEGDEFDAVVKTTRKAMVGELRKVAEIGAIQRGLRFEGAMACGHAFEHAVTTDAEGKPVAAPFEGIPRLGEGWPCLLCPEEFGETPAVPVVEISEEPICSPAATDPETGEPIPGAVIEPASVTYRVELSAGTWGTGR